MQFGHALDLILRKIILADLALGLVYNSLLDEDALEAMQFGHALDLILRKIILADPALGLVYNSLLDEDQHCRWLLSNQSQYQLDFTHFFSLSSFAGSKQTSCLPTRKTELPFTSQCMKCCWTFPQSSNIICFSDIFFSDCIINNRRNILYLLLFV